MPLIIEESKYQEIKDQALGLATRGQYRDWSCVMDVFAEIIDAKALNRIFDSVPFQRQLDRLCLEARGR